MGIVYGASALGNAREEPRTIMATAPKAAPPDTPISPGSASGLRKKPWSTVPATASEAPTVAANMTRGARISLKTVKSSLLASPLTISSKESGTPPIASADKILYD